MAHKINLGDEVKDAVTGFKGIAIARTQWMYGCDRITIQPAVGKDGKVPDNATFDEQSIILVKPKKIAGDNRPKKTGGTQDDKAALRRAFG